MSEQTQRVLLGVLLVVLLIVGARSLGFGGGPGGGVFGRSTDADFTSSLAVEVVSVQTDRLAASGGQYTPGRDPWSFGSEPRPTPPPRQIEEVSRPVDRQVIAPPVEVEPPKPKPPPVDVEYLGRFGPERLPIAVFTAGDDIVNAQRGDVINGKFRVEEIGYMSVQLSFVGFPEAPPAQVGISKKG